MRLKQSMIGMSVIWELYKPFLQRLSQDDSPLSLTNSVNTAILYTSVVGREFHPRRKAGSLPSPSEAGNYADGTT